MELDNLSERALGWLKRLTSPVFFSRAPGGAVQRGLAGVPRDRPLLFVGNHQTYALDIGLLVEEVLRETGTMPRGLAHPVVFQVTPPPLPAPAPPLQPPLMRHFTFPSPSNVLHLVLHIG